MMGDQQDYEVWFVHWNNGPGDPTPRSGPFRSQAQALARCAEMNNCEDRLEARAVRYVAVTESYDRAMYLRAYLADVNALLANAVKGTWEWCHLEHSRSKLAAELSTLEATQTAP